MTEAVLLSARDKAFVQPSRGHFLDRYESVRKGLGGYIVIECEGGVIS